MTETLISEIMTKAVAHVPASVREAETAIFKQSLRKAATMLGEPLTPWAERCLKRMGEQFTVFKGQAAPTLPKKRKR